MHTEQIHGRWELLQTSLVMKYLKVKDKIQVFAAKFLTSEHLQKVQEDFEVELQVRFSNAISLTNCISRSQMLNC